MERIIEEKRVGINDPVVHGDLYTWEISTDPEFRNVVVKTTVDMKTGEIIERRENENQDRIKEKRN